MEESSLRWGGHLSADQDGSGTAVAQTAAEGVSDSSIVPKAVNDANPAVPEVLDTDNGATKKPRLESPSNL